MLYITGITGHSGRWFFSRLESEGYQGSIRCVMRECQSNAPEKYKLFEHTKLNIEFAVGDLNDEQFLDESLHGVERIVHIAGITYSGKIAAAAVKNSVPWIILVHTTGRFSKYKSASEIYIDIEDNILSSNKIAHTVLRPTMIYGSSCDRNMYRLIGYLNEHRFFPLFGNGKNLMQPVHARDLGYAYYDVLMKPEVTMNKEYNLSGKEPLSYLTIVKTILNYLGKKKVIIPIPISISIFAARVYNKLFRQAIITVEQVMRMQEDKAFDHKAALHDFGFDPISFEEGIKEEIDEYLSGIRVDYSNIKY